MRNIHFFYIVAITTLLITTSSCNKGNNNYKEIDGIAIENIGENAHLYFNIIDGGYSANVLSNINGQVCNNLIAYKNNKIVINLNSNTNSGEKLTITLYDNYDEQTKEPKGNIVAQKDFDVPEIIDDNSEENNNYGS